MNNPSENKSNEDNSSHTLEMLKQEIDYIKHLTTLSTGSILLLATFLQKIFDHPKWKFLIAISFGGFIVSVIGAVIAYTFLIGAFEDKKSSGDYEYRYLIAVPTIVMWLSFLIGLGAFTFFAVINFLA